MLKRLSILPITLLLCGAAAQAQYAPQAPLDGNDAIIENDARITGWANACTLQRGWLDIADTSLGKPTLGNTASALGAPDADVLSLGDGGSATLTFPYTLRNGDGPDFAVFENGFTNPLDAAMAYLEFAFVEVSSDGLNFTRFPAACNIQDTLQSDNFTYSDASLVHNLAGKYISGYGTPFDLEELKNAPGLDVNHISHIRIVDVVGSLDAAYGSTDAAGHIINDPYPSHFVSGGFDLDAVAVLNDNRPNSIGTADADAGIRIYPNPATGYVQVSSMLAGSIRYRITDLYGRQLMQGTFNGRTVLDISALSPGLYLVQLDNGREQVSRKLSRQ